MRYDEWIHGLFRENSSRPNEWEVEQARREYRKEHPDIDKSPISGGVFLVSVVVLMILFAVLLKVNTYFAMIEAAITAIFLVIVELLPHLNPNLPKPDKNIFCNRVIISVSALMVIAYNICCLIGICGGDRDNASALGIITGWVGISYLVTSVFYGLKKNLKCTETGEATCIGYADLVVSGGDRSRDYVSTRCVYEFTHEGETYIVPGHKKTSMKFRLPEINSRSIVRFDPQNPEFCMVKRAEISAFVKGVIIGGLCILFCWSVIKSNILNTPKIPQEISSGIYVIDEDNNVAPIEDLQTSQTTEATTTETVFLGYTDEMIYEWFGTDNYIVLIVPVATIDGEYAFLGQVSGLTYDVVYSDGLSVGDRMLITIRENSELNYLRLNDGEDYLGDHTPESRGFVDEEGRFILNDEYLEFAFGKNINIEEYSYSGIEDDSYTFYSEDYCIQYDIVPGTGMYYWDLQPGDRYYILENDAVRGVIKADLYVIPE